MHGLGQLGLLGDAGAVPRFDLGQFLGRDEVDRAKPLAVGDQLVVLGAFLAGWADFGGDEFEAFGQQRRRAFKAFAGDTAHFDAAQFLIFRARDGACSGFADGCQRLTGFGQMRLQLAEFGFGGTLSGNSFGRRGGQGRHVGFKRCDLRVQLGGRIGQRQCFCLGGLGALGHFVDAAGGLAEIGGTRQSLRVLGNSDDAYALSQLQIQLGGGRTVRLADVATVRDGFSERTSISEVDGKEVVNFAMSRARGASDLSVYDAALAEMDKIEAENEGVKFIKLSTTTTYTRSQYESSIWALVEGAVLAVVVVFMFLRDWRATFISAVAIPLSAIPTFWFMDMLGFNLNFLSLLALALVAGVLVDDAIVEIENIVRHMRMGKTGYQAALDAADEIGLAVVATSATIIAVFAPVGFMGGFVGQYFKQFGLTVAAAVFFSLLVARLITPLIAAYTLKPHDEIRSADGPMMNSYLEVLRWGLQHRWTTIAGGTAFFIISVLLLVALPKSLIPPQDFSASQITIELPPGVRLEQTAAVSAQVRDLVASQPEVTDVIESIGGDEVRTANLYVSLVSHKERDLTQNEWEERVRPSFAAIPDARINFAGGDAAGGGRPLTLYLTSDDPVKLENAARAAVDAMRKLPELRDARISGDLERPEVIVEPRLDLAAELGVSVAAISQTIRIATLGDLPQNAAKFSLSDRQVPIRVSLLETSRQDLATLENLPVRTSSGGTVPLKAVAEIRFGEGPSVVRRYNQSRRVVIDSELNGVEIGPALAKVKALPEIKNLPEGVNLVEVGQAEFIKDVFTNFTLAIGAGVLLVFAVLVLLFARVFQPITILSALPLSVGGAAIALMLFGKPFSMPVVIGFLMLMGIVGKNSILLVDFAIEEMRAGKTRTEALIEAGHKRARPIIMTTVAMVAGMLPVALAVVGGEFRAPMGIAVIGGLITSTVLTLVIVPAVFSVIDDLEGWVTPRVSRLLNSSEAS